MTNNQLYVSSAILIPEIYSDYNINSDDFISRFPNWIYNALEELNFVQAYIDKTCNIEVVNYRGKLPEDFKGAIDLIIDNTKLPLKSTIDDIKFKDTIEKENNIEIVNKAFDKITKVKSEVEYYISNGWIHTNIESTTIYLRYKAIPTELDSNSGMEFPMIYDEGLLRRYLKLYIIRQILLRGYKHPVLNLKDDNPMVNPGLELMNMRNAVRVACNKFNKDRRENIAKALTKYNI